MAFGNILMKSFELPEGLITIGNKVFASSMMERLVLPSTLQTLSYSAFSSCTAIKEVYAKSTVPPVLNINANVTPFPKTSVLYVPVGTRDAYLATFCRGEFKEIIETDAFPTSIGGVAADGKLCCIYGTDGAILVVNNGRAPMPYHIYTADGKLVDSGVAQGGVTKISAARGTYILRVGECCSKVLVK